ALWLRLGRRGGNVRFVLFRRGGLDLRGRNGDGGGGLLLDRRRVAPDLVRLSLGQTLALDRLAVEQDRALQLAGALKQRDDDVQVVPVDRADVAEAQLLEELVRDDQVLH